MTDIFFDTWGTGSPVVLVHGSLATGAEEWDAQRPLAEAGFRLLVLDRRGYGQSPRASGEDFLRDGEDIAGIVGDGAHVVGHSYGGLGAMYAAVQRPEAIRSLALLEPPVFAVDSHDDSAGELEKSIRGIWSETLSDSEWLARFIKAVGTDPATLLPEVLDQMTPLVPLLRDGRPPWDQSPPTEQLAAAPFPKLVVSGAHSPGFDAICDDLAARIGAARAVVAGAGHEIQLTGAPINDTLRDFWHTANPVAPRR